MTRWASLLLLLSLAAANFPALAADTASGSGTLYGKPWSVRASIAHLEDGYTFGSGG